MISLKSLSISSWVFISLMATGTISSCNNTKKPDSTDGTLTADSIQAVSEQKAQMNKKYHLDMPTVIKNTQKVLLSDLAKSIRYIVLETSSKYMIGEKNVMVRPCAEYIFIGVHGKPIGVFDSEGKFVRTIGVIGRGPTEYNYDYIFWPDASTRKVYISNTNIRGISSYSFEGEHTGDIHPEVQSMSFIPMGNEIFLSWTFRQQEFDSKFFRLYFHDGQGKILSRIFEPEKIYDFSGGLSIMSPQMTYAPDGILYNSWEDDQICKAKIDYSFEPVLTWDLGQLKMPSDLQRDYQRFQREMVKYLIDISTFETPGNWLLRFYYKGQPQFAVLEKSSGDFYLVSNPDKTKDREGLVNDIDGGPSFWPDWYTDQGTRFFRLVQAFDLTNEGLNKQGNLEIKDRDAAAAFQAMVSELDANSNPVLMVVEMK